MKPNVLQRITESLNEQVGIHFNATYQKLLGNKNADDPIIERIEFRPDVPKCPWGYIFAISIYPKRFEINFVPDSYALPLIRDMEKKVPGRPIFSGIAKILIEKSTQLSFKINDNKVSVTDPANWCDNWKKVEISLEKYSANFDYRNDETIEKPIVQYASKFFTMVIALMPVEEAPNNDFVDVDGLPEGAKIRIEVNKYERNPLNRGMCIAFHGVACKVCNLFFEKKYGQLGLNYIQVHHIKPVSQIGAGYVIDPINDLVPVCANCHAMLHREDPPLTIERLKEIVLANHKCVE